MFLKRENWISLPYKSTADLKVSKVHLQITTVLPSDCAEVESYVLKPVTGGFIECIPQAWICCSHLKI